MDSLTKICTKCGVEKGLKEFTKRLEGKLKRRSQCKICRNKHGEQLCKQNKEKYKNIDVNKVVKTCTGCGIEKLLVEFDQQLAGKYIRRAACKDCSKKYKKQLAKSNQEKYKDIDVNIITKVCFQCGIEKLLREFCTHPGCKYGRNSKCKACQNAYSQEWYGNNTIKHRDQGYKWRNNNKEKINQTLSVWRKKRYGSDLQFKIKDNLRSSLYKAIKGNYKSGSAVRDLGCAIKCVKKYLLTTSYSRSTGEPMTEKAWMNGEIHIDHIVPLSSFDLTNREELLKAVHYTNLQLLWKEDNLTKKDKLDWIHPRDRKKGSR